MKIDYVMLGKNIRKFRLLADLTQKQLAEIVNCSTRHIGQVEIGKNIPSLEITVAIANALKVGIDQLVYSDLDNRMDYFIEELAMLTEGFEGKDKVMAIELTKAIINVLRDLRVK